MSLSSSEHTPTPDPNSSPVGISLLDYKRLLVEVLKQLQLPELYSKLDPIKILRSDIETHINDVSKVFDEAKTLADEPANEPVINQFLSSSNDFPLD